MIATAEEWTPPTGRIGPPTPADKTERARQNLREQALTDFYFFTKSILGYDLLTPHTHGALCRFIEGCRSLRRMIQMPRSHFKTTIATISQAMWLAVKDPNIRILLVAQSSANAQRFLLEVQNHLLGNELLRWLFADVIPANVNKARWNAQELQLNRSSHFREPTMDTIGSRGAVESRHYDHIIADDIIGEKEFNSQTEMEKTIEWASGLESLLVTPELGKIDFVGTRWRTDDVYAAVEKYFSGSSEPAIIGPHAVKQGELAIFRRKARENGEPIFPELFSNKFFERMMRENPQRYAAQYANDPRAAGVAFIQPEWLRYYTLGGPNNKYVIYKKADGEERRVRIDSLDRIVVFDPAVAERKGNSRNAMLVLGMVERDIFVLDTYIGSYNPADSVELIFELDKKWNPRVFSIEEVAYQKAIRYWLRQYADHKMLPLPAIRSFKPGSEKTKDERIKGLQPLFRNGQIWYLEGQTELIDETLEYTLVGRTPKRDALDALSQCLEIFRLSWSETHESEIREAWQKRLKGVGVTGYGQKRLRVVR